MYLGASPFVFSRCGLNGIIKTLSLAIGGMRLTQLPSVNGDKQDGGFDDVEGEVFPCAGSYRSGVTIRLLKVGHRTVGIRFARVNGAKRPSQGTAIRCSHIVTLREGDLSNLKVEMG